MSIPCAQGFSPESMLQLRISTLLRRTWMPSSCAAETNTRSSRTFRASSTSIPFTPPTTATLRIVTSLARTTMPPRTTAPGSPTSVSRSSITSGPRWTPAARWTTGGLIAYAVPAAPERTATTAAASTTPARPSSPPSCAYVRRASGRTACPSTCADAEPARDEHRQAELQGAERQREPARLVVEHRVVDEDVEREADPGHHRGELERPPRALRGRKRECNREREEHGREP